MKQRNAARTTVAVLLLGSTPVLAQNATTDNGIAWTDATVTPSFVTAPVLNPLVQRPPLPRPFAPPQPATRGPLLPVLYGSLITLNTADTALTRTILAAGGTEKNPFMQSIAGSTAAMTAVKAGTSAMSIFLAEKLWPRNKAAAVAAMLVANGIVGAAVIHNTRQLGP